MDEPMSYIGCGCVVGDGQGRYLLVRETKAVARGRLALPAGSLEPDESIPAAAVREVLEETGLRVELDGLLGVFHCERTSENSFGVNFVFAADIIGGELTPSPEHPEMVWLTHAEIQAAYEAGSLRGGHVVEAIRRVHAAYRLGESVITPVPAAK